MTIWSPARLWGEDQAHSLFPAACVARLWAVLSR